jgi:phosphohistidine swiveling domain-containing protein
LTTVHPPFSNSSFEPLEPWNPLHTTTEPDVHWTRANVGEAMPGVQTPLSWTVWAEAVERASRDALFAIGALTRKERAVPPRAADRAVRAFYGRPALRVDFLTTLGDRMPGTTGEETARNVFGSVPPNLELHPTRRRYPVVACRFPLAFAVTPARCRWFARETDFWYTARLAAAPSLDRAGASALFVEAKQRFVSAVGLQVLTLFAAVQPLYQALEAIVASAGIGDPGTLSGGGGAESAVITDIWRAAAEEITLGHLVAAHGFHGPLEGELSSRVWREDAAPLRNLLGLYAEREDPRRASAGPGRAVMQRTVTATFSSSRRPAVRAVLALAARMIPLRGVVKRSFLQCFDVARASARRYGALLESAGRLETADDVFFLLCGELAGDRLPAGGRATIADRQTRHAEYQRFDLPASWTGSPTPLGEQPQPVETAITGTGVSAGIVEGIASVVTDPTFAEVTIDTVLVAATTDPSWSSIMYLSRGLVVDIGGAMSHAAVVAREIGIPCVVGTGSGTHVIRTGDRIRVDGRSGVVEILERAHPDERKS